MDDNQQNDSFNKEDDTKEMKLKEDNPVDINTSTDDLNMLEDKNDLKEKAMNFEKMITEIVDYLWTLNSWNVSTIGYKCSSGKLVGYPLTHCVLWYL